MLQILSPQNILKRGFSIVRSNSNKTLKSIKGIQVDDNLTLEFIDGFLESQVTSIDTNNNLWEFNATYSPEDTDLYFGDIIIIKSLDNKLVDFKKKDYLEFYEMACGGFESIDSSDDNIDILSTDTSDEEFIPSEVEDLYNKSINKFSDDSSENYLSGDDSSDVLSDDHNDELSNDLSGDDSSEDDLSGDDFSDIDSE